MRAIVIVLLLSTISLAGCLADAPEDAPTEMLDDGTVVGPSWTFTDIDGVTHSRDSSMGNVSVLFFMATWCSSCRANAPRLAAVHADEAASGLQVFSLSWDPTEGKDDLRAWQEKYDQPWPHGIDTGSSVAQTFGIRSQSSLVVLDADGIVVARFGYPGASESDLREAVARADAAA